MKKIVVQILKFLLFLGVGVAILWLLYRSQNAAYQEDCALKGISSEQCNLFQKVLDDFGRVNYWWIFGVFIAYTLSNISRAIRWRMLLRPLGHNPSLTNSFVIIIIAYFANLGLPRLGEIVRAGLMARYERIAVEKVFGTIVVDRIVDVISILILGAIALFFEMDMILAFVEKHIDLNSRFGGMGNFLLLLSLGFAAFAALIWLFRKQLTKTIVFQKIASILSGFWQGIQSIRSLERPWIFILHSINVWGMFFVMSYLLIRSFPPTAHLPVSASLVVFVFGALGVAVPSPGGMGTYHLMVQLGLGLYGVSGEDGFSWANISFFSVQLGVNVLGGLLCLFLLPYLNRHNAAQPVVKGSMT